VGSQATCPGYRIPIPAWRPNRRRYGSSTRPFAAARWSGTSGRSEVANSARAWWSSGSASMKIPPHENDHPVLPRGAPCPRCGSRSPDRTATGTVATIASRAAGRRRASGARRPGCTRRGSREGLSLGLPALGAAPGRQVTRHRARRTSGEVARSR
jgi:hypothetical protein